MNIHEALKVAQDFRHAAECGDKRCIECYTLDDILAARVRLANSAQEASFSGEWYSAMQDRIEHLRAAQGKGERPKRAYGGTVPLFYFCLGLLAGLVIAYIERRF